MAEPPSAEPPSGVHGPTAMRRTGASGLVSYPTVRGLRGTHIIKYLLQIGILTMVRWGTFNSYFFGWVHVGVRAVACRGCFSLRIQPRRLFWLGRAPCHGYRTTSFPAPLLC